MTAGSLYILYIDAEGIALIAVCVPGNAAIFSVLSTGHCHICISLLLFPEKNIISATLE
jgi:hypothetical protein